MKIFQDDIPYRYIMIMGDPQEIKDLYGDINLDSKFLYSFGVPIYLLSENANTIESTTKNALETAEKLDIPVWFQLDDMNCYIEAMGYGIRCDEWYNDPVNLEKYSFGDSEAAHYWYNWGSYVKNIGLPCFNSEGFLKFMHSQIQDGFLSVLKPWLEKIHKENKDYLFAGVCVGWETNIPDMSSIEEGTVSVKGDLITDIERGQTGYRALENLGYTQQKLENEAQALGISTKLHMFNLLQNVQQQYSATLAKQIFDIGVEKTKIFTHVICNSIRDGYTGFSSSCPSILTAVNEYSTPGFTIWSLDAIDYNLYNLVSAIKKYDPSQKYYGNVEGYTNDLNNDTQETISYFERQFATGCLVVSVYGFGDPETSQFYVGRDINSPFHQAVLYFIKTKR